jgi:hypothetical protein
LADRSQSPVCFREITMTDAKYHAPETGSLEGRVFRPTSSADLGEAIELAFDYRGDITVELKSGNKVTGYLFNRTATGEQPTIELFPSTSNGTMTIPYSEVATIAFTGEDTATGKSWETWVAKKDSERQREVERVEADAKSRGHL